MDTEGKMGGKWWLQKNMVSESMLGINEKSLHA